MSKKDFEKAKKQMIDDVLDVCETHGYLTGNEPLCLLVEDCLNWAYEWCKENLQTEQKPKRRRTCPLCENDLSKCGYEEKE